MYSTITLNWILDSDWSPNYNSYVTFRAFWVGYGIQLRSFICASCCHMYLSQDKWGDYLLLCGINFEPSTQTNVWEAENLQGHRGDHSRVTCQGITLDEVIIRHTPTGHELWFWNHTNHSLQSFHFCGFFGGCTSHNHCDSRRQRNQGP